jgi:hypothetical protein
VIDGRIEDMLALSIDSPEPLLTGELTSKSTLKLPPGDTPVRERLHVEGSFGLGGADFASAKVQESLAELSRRSQGQNEEEAAKRVLSHLAGEFTLASGVFRAHNLRFLVPGADIRLAGTYDLGTEALDFEGELRMDASASEAMGGFKAILIKPFDFIFRQDGAGAVVPISVKGTWRKADTNLDWGRIWR